MPGGFSEGIFGGTPGDPSEGILIFFFQTISEGFLGGTPGDPSEGFNIKNFQTISEGIFTQKATPRK